jgi:hypothetical protein
MAERRGQGNRLTRRKALKKIAGSVGAAVTFPILTNARPFAPLKLVLAAQPVSLLQTYAPRFFTADQMKTVAALAEMIIPADEHSPGARAARVHEFVDTIIADSSQTRKDSWINGLAAVDKLAKAKYEKNFAECTSIQQTNLLRQISVEEGHPTTPEGRFFVAIKNAAIEGYYTSAIGIHQDLEYQGNTALGEFEGCVHTQHKRGTK